MTILRFLVFAAAFVGCSQNLGASVLNYNVSLNTSFLTAPGAFSSFTWPPYLFDFQYIAGDDSLGAPHSVTVSSPEFTTFSLTAGTVPGGGENLVAFIPSDLTVFSVQIDDGINSTVTPDLLDIFVCDNAFDCVPTTDPGGFNAVVEFRASIDPANPSLLVTTYDTTNNQFNPVITDLGSAAPEPATLFFGGFGTLLLGLLRFYSRSWRGFGSK
jgi:hypothetical protein